jgi:hypothetical protein
MMYKLYNLLISNIIILYEGFTRYFFKVSNNDTDFEIIVISKDRPFCLRSYLNSVLENFKDTPKITAVICCSSHTTKKRYEKIIKDLSMHNEIAFIYENLTFKNSFLKALNRINSSHVMLSVDDQVFFKPVLRSDILSALNEADIFTLRLGVNITYSFNLDKFTELPKHLHRKPSIILWKQNLDQNDFQYALSFDTTIIKKSILINMAKLLFYKTPNQLESSMNYSKYFRYLLVFKIGAFKEQKAVNFVINKIQTDNNNRALDYTIEHLNTLFDQGFIVKADSNHIHDINSSHDAQNYIFEKKL